MITGFSLGTALVTDHGYDKSTVKSPVKPASSGGTTRRVLSVYNESDRGRVVARDELAVVAQVSTYPANEYWKMISSKQIPLDCLRIKFFSVLQLKVFIA
jgi:hypothetical protein